MESRVRIPLSPMPVIADAYRLARIGAQRETGLADDTFPDACPYTCVQLANDTFLPE